MNDKKTIIKAFVVLSETNNTVLIHFDGFEDYEDAKDFSDYMINQLGIEKINVPFNRTLH
tara:strand:+ start:862 stop:1041 length:180 start_codon:yes stop_codon:yes gene_type:complete